MGAQYNLTNPIEATSALPAKILVTAGTSDSAAVTFVYQIPRAESWNSNDQAPPYNCSMGAYDSGNRKMDCSFNCPAASN